MSTEEQKRTVAQPKVKKERTYKKYTVDFNSPVENKLLSLEAAAKYLTSNIKVGGLKGKLGEKCESVKVLTDSKNNKVKNSVQVQVDNKLKFSKRYIKYLVKKFLKREGIVKYLTVASTAPNAYTVKVLRKNEE
jgi:large subunit ribosomal protein L22e